MTRKRGLKFLISGLIILSVLTWGPWLLAIGSTLVIDSSEENAFLGALVLVAYISYIPWVLVLFLTTMSIIMNVPNKWIKIGIGVGMTPFLLIAALSAIMLGSIGFNSVSLKLNSPIAHYLKGQVSGQSTDLSQFFEKSATKSEIFAILAEQKYTRGIRSNEAYDQWYEEALAKDPPVFEYGFRRSITCIPTVAKMSTTLRLKFDENGKLISATGTSFECNM